MKVINAIPFPRARAFAIAAISAMAVSGPVLAAVEATTTGWVMGRAPTMLAPTITHGDTNSNGVVDDGDTLTAVDGTFTDLDGDTKGTTTYRWNDGTTDLATTAEYTVVAGDAGKTISLFATPNTDSTDTDPAVGVESTAATVTVVADGTLVSVAITGADANGNPIVGTDLTATPTCTGTCPGTETYQWQIEDAVGSGTYVDVASATSSTYTPVAGDQKRKLKVVVN